MEFVYISSPALSEKSKMVKEYILRNHATKHMKILFYCIFYKYKNMIFLYLIFDK
jgi:hypothetical protein